MGLNFSSLNSHLLMTRKESDTRGMHFLKVRPILGFLGRGLLLVLLALMIAACFGSSKEDTPVPTDTPIPPTQAPTAAPAPTATSVPAAASSGTTTTTTTTTITTASAAPTKPAAAPIVFQIDPSQSEARFIVDEVLFGSPNTVTGRTNGVSGQISIDMTDPTKTTVGPIQIDARSLETDNRFRNRSISR